ncbi:helix-turn-helix domain-containing protein [Streptomyces pristinaespiralis]|nr:helix-turn-helix domain-containing protein [Streptomyces pristinaespiralis]ALC19422.1 HTH_3 domain-containing protein [Streptomyces pristinaespiralis]QMU17540.1 helix-turn-helix domain-containing protein [Streptomyces pristinaespiralis]
MTHEVGVERRGVHGRLSPVGAARATARTKRLGDALKRRREELGLSLEEVAARLGITAYTYATWERTPGRQWPEDTLCALIDALELNDQQGGRLLRLAVDRDAPAQYDSFGGETPVRPSGPVPPSRPARRPAPSGPAAPVPPPVPVRPPEPSPQPPSRPEGPSDPETLAYLRDYATMMDAVPLPSVLFDRHWDVAHTNPAFDALFRGIGPHPTAMPDRNFLRFVLFHPDARTVLGEHETSWCLPLMAQLAAALDKHGDDDVLQAIRDDIADDPIMDAAYRCGLPHWMSAVGALAIHHDGAVRPVNHPDPRWGRTQCRIIDETPTTLRDKEYTRMTLVLRENQSSAVPGVRRGKTHLRAVSGG